MKRSKVILLLTVVITSLSCSSFLRTLKYLPSTEILRLEFNETESNSQYRFFYSDTTNNEFLRQLRLDYELDKLSEKANSQLEKVKIILDWAHNQWEHSGSNQPSKSDALTILKEAREGSKFRCVEYGIITASALKSIGIKARVLALKTRDVEKAKYGAGHVLTEAYLDEFQNWVMIDVQFNLIPILNSVPLNAVEFQKAIIEKQPFQLENNSGEVTFEKRERYLKFIPHYLYYFDVAFDNREGFNLEKKQINGKRKLMLVPIGVKPPTIFQRKYPINNCAYTNSLMDFYEKP